MGCLHIIFGLASLALYTQAIDVTCVRGTKTKDVTLNEGDSFSFDTRGTKYAGNQKCQANYAMGTCSAATVTCQPFSLNNRNNRCTRGDKLIITDATQRKIFCKTNGPDGYAVSGDFSLNFVSDRRRSAVGFKCVVQCTSGGGGGVTVAPTTAPPSNSDCKCGLAKRASRIVGGTITEVNEYPWQVGLVSTNGNFIWCGGSVIGDRWVMTAAHCTAGETAGAIQVLLGEHDQSTSSETASVRANVVQIIDHPNYNSATTNTDFSILKLSAPIDFAANPHIRPICLPADDSNTYAGTTATVTGWGTTASGGSTSSKLREVNVQVLTNAQCTSMGYSSSDITNQMLCASVPEGGKDSCQGDSGGPLVTAGTGDGVTAGQNYELIGVVSWGIGCAQAQYPGVYARVSKQVGWINTVTGGNLNSCPRV